MLKRRDRVTGARREGGFTLIELLVTITIAMIVFAATLNVLDVFSSDSQAMTQRNAAQNQARLAIDGIVRQLRNIAASATSPKLLQLATPYDIVFETVGAPTSLNAAGTERVRYCVPADPAPGSPSTEVLIAQTQTWGTTSQPSDPGNPWTSAGKCPDGVNPYTVVASGVTNRYQDTIRPDRPAFSFNGSTTPPTDLTTIDTVGINLFVNPTPTVGNAESELQSAAFLRNEQQLPVAAFTTSSLGSGAVLLNAGTAYSPSGATLSYSWTCAPIACSSAGADFSWRPGAGTYTVTLKVTDQTGLSNTTSQTVTVT